MDVEELLALTGRITEAERKVQELNLLLIAFCLKTMDDKEIARLEKPLLDKAPGFSVTPQGLKSGSLKLIVKKIGSGEDGG